METRRYRPSIVGPLMLISVGVLLLLNQAGRLPWNIWGVLWRFWPVILILIGVEVLIGVSRSPVVYVVGLFLALVVIAATVLYAVYFGGQAVGSRPIAETEQILETMRDAERGEVTLRLAAGTLNLGALADSPNFVEGTVEYARYSERVNRSFSDRSGKIKFSLESRGQPVPFLVSTNNLGERWNLKLTPRIPLELDVGTGAGSVQMDLSDLKVTRLEFKGGAGQTTIHFPSAAGLTQASVATGVGEIVVRIPDNVGAKIRISKALTSVRVENPRFTRADDQYVSANYQAAENKLDLEISSAIGAVVIQ